MIVHKQYFIIAERKSISTGSVKMMTEVEVKRSITNNPVFDTERFRDLSFRLCYDHPQFSILSWSLILIDPFSNVFLTAITLKPFFLTSYY